MGLASATGAVNLGAVGQIVEVQAHIAAGLPRTTIVGLADTAVSESRDRVRSAIVNSGFSWPDQRITVGLSPASQQKRGSGLDFAIAIAVLAADARLSCECLDNTAFIGELGLDGSVRPVSGAVAMASELARQRPGSKIFVSVRSCAKWALAPGVRPVPVESLAEAVSVLRQEVEPRRQPDPPVVHDEDRCEDLSDVLGQRFGGQALEVAAAGGHHILFTGPPGVGKTMLCRRLPGILPRLTLGQLLEVAAIAEAASDTEPSYSRRPPFQAPHHTASHIALIGGAAGARVRPGLVSLAHHGLLFLDEAPEFRRASLEALRQPLEEGRIAIARSGVSTTLPARFQLALTQNPCPCGQAETPGGDCRCTPLSKRRYESRLSGPLLDRVDLRIRVAQPLGNQPCDSSARVRERVIEARARAHARMVDADVACNSAVPADVIRKYWPWPSDVRDFLASEQKRNRRSVRAMDKTVKVSWTIADLAGRDQPSIDDAALALRLRNETI